MSNAVIHIHTYIYIYKWFLIKDILGKCISTFSSSCRSMEGSQALGRTIYMNKSIAPYIICMKGWKQQWCMCDSSTETGCHSTAVELSSVITSFSTVLYATLA